MKLKPFYPQITQIKPTLASNAPRNCSRRTHLILGSITLRYLHLVLETAQQKICVNLRNLMKLLVKQLAISLMEQLAIPLSNHKTVAK